MPHLGCWRCAAHALSVLDYPPTTGYQSFSEANCINKQRHRSYNNKFVCRIEMSYHDLKEISRSNYKMRRTSSRADNLSFRTTTTQSQRQKPEKHNFLFAALSNQDRTHIQHGQMLHMRFRSLPLPSPSLRSEAAWYKLTQVHHARKGMEIWMSVLVAVPGVGV